MARKLVTNVRGLTIMNEEQFHQAKEVNYREATDLSDTELIDRLVMAIENDGPMTQEGAEALAYAYVLQERNNHE